MMTKSQFQRSKTGRPNKANKSSKKQETNKFFQPNRLTVVTLREIGGFPDVYHTRLRYNIAGTLLGAGTGTVVNQNYYLNAPASNSHSPKGWNVLKEVYDQYLVTGFKARVTITNLSSTIPVKMWVIPVNDNYIATVTSSLVTFAETDGAMSRQLGIAAGGHDVAIMDYPYTSISALYGSKKPVDVYNDDLTQFTGSPNSASSYAVPNLVYQLVIAAYSLNGSNIAANSLSLSLELDMDVTLYAKLPVY